jgi:hypothetical protein
MWRCTAVKPEGRIHTMDAAGKSLATCAKSTLAHVQAGSLRIFLDGEELRWTTQATLDRSFYTCVARPCPAKRLESLLPCWAAVSRHYSDTLAPGSKPLSVYMRIVSRYRVAIRLCTSHLAPTTRQIGLHIEAAIGLERVDGDCPSTVCNVVMMYNGPSGPCSLATRTVVNHVLWLGCSLGA